MAAVRPTRSREFDVSMASRAAWLHFAGGLTQAQVAKRLGLSGVKAHRLITRATQEGLVRFVIDGDVSECLTLENQLTQAYQLDYCEVVPDFDDTELPLKALGIAGGQYLKRQIELNQHRLIGVGHGRTLAACIDHLPVTPSINTEFVSLLGGFSRKFAANPHDVIHRLAERTGAQAYVMPLPFFANSVDDREVLLGQHGIRDVFELGERSTLKLAGIGSTDTHSSLVATGMIERSEIKGVQDSGGAGELLGHFFSDTGDAVNTPLSDRTMSLPRDALKKSELVAVAGGTTKTRAIRSVLHSRILGGLITDECTARALVESASHAEDETATVASKRS